MIPEPSTLMLGSSWILRLDDAFSTSRAGGTTLPSLIIRLRQTYLLLGSRNVAIDATGRVCNLRPGFLVKRDTLSLATDFTPGSGNRPERMTPSNPRAGAAERR